MNNYQIVKNTEWKEVEINGESLEIPIDWDVKKFEEFSSICRGGSPRPIQQFLTEKKDGTPWIKISDATKVNKYIDSTEQYIIKEGETKSRLVYPGDLIVSNSATPGIPRFLNIKACIHDGWLLLRDFKGVNKEFLFQLIGFVREKLKSQGSGSIFTNLSIDILSNFECLIPTISQQSSIASILSTQESVIQNIESLIVKYESRFQYLSDELLSGRLRVKEVDGQTVLYKNPEDNWKEVEINGEMKEIPKDWEVEKISNIAEFKNGYAFSKKDYSLNKNYALIEVGNITLDGKMKIKKENKYIDKLTDKLESFLLNKNDIVLPMTDMSHERVHVGTPVIIEEDNKFILNQRVGAIKLKNKSLVKYVYFSIKSNQPYFGNNTVGGGPYNMGTNVIKDFEFNNPIENECLVITEILVKQDELIFEQKELLSKEKQKFDWLLDNLLSGKYLVQEKL